MSELITKETPEPEESLFFIDGTIFVIAEDGGYGEPGYYGEPWEELRKENLGRTIESLAEHDERIRREALTATDEELSLMEAAFDASIDDREDDGIGAMGIAMKALAKSRERES